MEHILNNTCRIVFKKLISSPRKEQGQTMAAGEAKANPGGQQTIEVHLHKSRGVQRPEVMQEHKLKPQGSDTMSGCLPELSHESFSCCDLVGNCSGWVNVRTSGLKRLLPGGWDILWHAGKSILCHIGLSVGYLRDETKMGKWML